jgi:hypothetical protein
MKERKEKGPTTHHHTEIHAILSPQGSRLYSKTSFAYEEQYFLFYVV